MSSTLNKAVTSAAALLQALSLQYKEILIVILTLKVLIYKN